MNPYADLPGRRAAQVAADLGVLAWVVVWVLLGRAAHGAVASLAEVGLSVRDRGTALAVGLEGAGEQAADVPLLGDRLAGGLDGAAQAAAGLAGSGADLARRVETLADVVGVAVALVPVLLVVPVWLLVRVLYARRAAATRRLAATAAGRDLLALRALVTRPLPVLESVAADPVAAWRTGDPAVVDRLAGLEARRRGLVLRA